jgi:Flp pilus assembly protein TadD
MRPRRRKHVYGGKFLLTIIVTVLATGYTFWLMRPASAAVDESAGVVPMEVGDGYTVKNVAAIHPRPESYAPFAAEDRLWRERSLARMMAAMRIESSSSGVWVPGPEQVLDDSVFALARVGQYAAAAALLERWMEAHPEDSERAITLARLFGQLGQADASFAWYERALASRLADRALRREYADALLWSGRYDAASEQFARLVTIDDADRGARLGLARALAWGGKAAEAEPLLARSWKEDPADTVLRALLRSTRANVEPTSGTARVWVDSDPSHWPYRLSLARAYVREGRHGDAAVAFDIVLADSVSVPLLSEAAGARAASRDSVGTAALLGRAVAMAPLDLELRERHAQALAWSGDRHAAIAEYTRILARTETAALRLARGQLHLFVGDESSALADLERSATLEPSYVALAAIGDLYRWRGDLVRSRAAYTRALALQPADARVLAALALLRSAERATLAQRDAGDEPGWSVGGSYAEDNAGFLMLRTRLAYGFTHGRATSGSIGVEQRRISHRSPRDIERYVYGYSIGAALQHFFNRVQVGFGGGVARHALVRDMMHGHASVSAPVGPVIFTLRAATGPAYPELWSLWALVGAQPQSRLEAPLRARTMMASASVPVGNATVEIGAERMAVGDGNRRTSYNVAVRQPISGSFRVLYAAGSMGWSGEATGYWDPRNYTQHAIGVEYGRAVGSNVTVAARALAGVARTTERVLLAPGAQPIGSSWSPQFSTGVDATYRGRTFEITAGGGYGRGAPRDAGVPGYQTLNGSVRVRINWP